MTEPTLREMAEQIAADDYASEANGYAYWSENHSCGMGRYGCCGGGKDINRAALRDAIEAFGRTVSDAATADEHKLRKWLWLNHGHLNALYGDDGEHQCQRCMPTWDYKRMPLADVVKAAMKARADAATAAERQRCAEIARHCKAWAWGDAAEAVAEAIEREP